MRKEYVIQFSGDGGYSWRYISEFKAHPLQTEEEARKELEERTTFHPWNIYRIVVRMVTDWEVI